MTDEPTVQPTGSGGTEGGTPPTATTAAATEDGGWRNMVPKEFRDDPSLKPYKDFGSLIKSHVHLNKLLGAEPRVPPKDAPPDAWNQFYAALGRPDTPDKYEVPVPEGREASPRILEAFRRSAHEAGLSGSQAHKIAESFFGALAADEDEIAADLAGRTERVERELKREYGQAYDNNLRLASKFARDFGGQDLLNWLETSGEGSNPLLIRAFVAAARTMTEDRLGPTRSGSFGYTPGEAQAEISRLRTDKDFTTAYYDGEHPGHKAAVDRMAALHKAAFPTEDTP